MSLSFSLSLLFTLALLLSLSSALPSQRVRVGARINSPHGWTRLVLPLFLSFSLSLFLFLSLLFFFSCFLFSSLSDPFVFFRPLSLLSLSFPISIFLLS